MFSSIIVKPILDGLCVKTIIVHIINTISTATSGNQDQSKGQGHGLEVGPGAEFRNGACVYINLYTFKLYYINKQIKSVEKIMIQWTLCVCTA